MINLELPLFAFLFATPWAAFAAAAGAVSIPILIHLFSRRRYRIVTWAAMRFLLAAQKQTVRRMRLEQYLLLATRTLILLLLVLAMASVAPWAEALWAKLFPDSAVLAVMHRRTHKVVVLDGSFSMGLKEGDRTCFDLARAQALQLIETAPGGDGFSVLLLAAPPQRIVPEPSDDPQKVADEVRKLRLPHGNGDLAGALHAVEDMLRRSPGKYEAREVYFFTDLQKSTWTGRASAEASEVMQRLQGQARVVFVDVGHEAPGNRAITNLTLGAPLAATNTVTPIIATVQNYGAEEGKAVRVELRVGKARQNAADPPFDLRTVAQEMVRVPAGRTGLAVAFSHKFSTPGDYAVQVRLENDNLELDDARTMIVRVKNTVPVMLVNGKPAVEEYDKATGYLRDALQPTDGRGPSESPIRPRVLSESQFADAALGDLTGYDCVFLCDVARLSTPEVKRLEVHLRRGGGLVFCLGPRVDLEAYNRLLFKSGEGVLPARLLGVQRAAPDRPFMFFAPDEDFRLPPLDAFASIVGRFNLLEPRFAAYVRAEVPAKGRGRKVLGFIPEPQRAGAGVPARPPADPAATLPSGDPAIVEAPNQRGRVLLVTTTVNKDWNNWADRPSMLAMMHELLQYAAAGRLNGQAVLVGEPLEEFLPAGSVGLEVTTLTPDLRTVRGKAEDKDETALFRFGETDQSGIYKATVGQHPREYLFAVNVPTVTDAQQASESDLTRLNREEVKTAYPPWDFQLVTDPKNVNRAGPSGSETQQATGGVGPAIARILLALVLLLLLGEVVLAWKLGHWGKTGVGSQTPPADGLTLPGLVGGLAAVCFVVTAGVLLHTLWTGDFLGFLPDSWRGLMESTLGVPQPVAGESTRWRLDYTPYLPQNAALEPWLVGVVALAAVTLVIGIYLREGQTAGVGYRLLLAGLRCFVVFMAMFVMLPQLQLWFERQGWPDVIVLIDDSQSMSAVDAYQNPELRETAAKLGAATGLAQPQRLQLAQALLTHPDANMLEELLTRRKVKLHVYHCSSRAARLMDVTEPDHCEATRQKVQALQAKGESSQLGTALRQVLNDFRGATLAAVVMFTDGVTTEGEDVAQAGQYAAQMGVPLYFVGIGDQHEVRDLYIQDLQAEDTVFVNDRLVFEARLTAQGYTNLPPVTVTLREKTVDGQVKELATERVIVDPQGKPVKFRLTHRPTEPGEKTFIIDVPVQPDEAQPADNNRVERTVFVREAKPANVLYIEGYPRYEYRYIKALLEREGGAVKGNKTINLKVLLLDADDEFPTQDRSARAEFPTKEELNQFDVVMLGDVDPKHAKLGEKNLKLLADFVRERGGGLLVLAGERHCPHGWKDSVLADILPVQVAGPEPAPVAERRDSFRPVLTPVGQLHPIFRFSPDETENGAIWTKLSEMFYYAEGYRLQPAAEVLAVHPQRKALAPKFGAGGIADDRHPLVVQHFVGAGRCLFFGFDETWRWRLREDELRFNQFWIQTVKYLARTGLGKIDLRVNRSTPYRKGEPIQVTVRFPDDAPAPGPETAVKVVVERRPLQGGEAEVETLQLAKLEGSRATFEAIKTRTPEGEYRFWLSSPPVVGAKPRAECKVLPPPGEMEKLRMNQVDLERAAEQTRGKFYTLNHATQLLDDLPAGTRLSLSTPGPPWLLWNHLTMFLLVVGLFTGEWVLRKRKHLL
ncbi:MAG: VWA domain-containing protein [Planctomycetia bacterium]|nr:VWA domain-containing protein [Planctomycetia bacterium]